MIHGGCGDFEDVAVLTRDPLALEHFWSQVEHASEGLARSAGILQSHDGHHRYADLAQVHLRGVAGDDPFSFEPSDPIGRCGGAEPDPPRELGNAGTSICLQFPEDVPINFVQCHGHGVTLPRNPLTFDTESWFSTTHGSIDARMLVLMSPHSMGRGPQPPLTCTNIERGSPMSKVRSVEPLLQAALNGDRVHPAAPRTPEDIAAQARAAVAAGARSLHLHPYGEDGLPTFAAEPCATTLRAVRAACPGWTELPDLVTANQGEEGIVELCEFLASRGIGIEAGLLSLDDAHRFVASGIAARCVRAMVEPLDADPDAAVAHAAAIEQALADAGVSIEQVHHGDGIASWAVNQRAIPRGHGIRTGLEDTPVLPDGRMAEGNGDLVAAAASMLERYRSSERAALPRSPISLRTPDRRRGPT